MPQYEPDYVKIFSKTTCPQTGVKKRYQLIPNGEIQEQRGGENEAWITRASSPKLRDIKVIQYFEQKGITHTHVYIDPQVVLKPSQIEARDFQFRNAKGEPAVPTGMVNITFIEGLLIPSNHIIQAFLDESPYNEKNAALCGTAPIFRELINQNPQELRVAQAKERKLVIQQLADYERTHTDEEMKELLKYAVQNYAVKGVELSGIDRMSAIDVSGILDLACEAYTRGMSEAIADVSGLRKANEIQKWLKDSLLAYTIGSQKGTKAAVVYTDRITKTEKKLEEVILNLPTKEEFLNTIKEKMAEDFEEFKTFVSKPTTPITPIQFYHHLRTNQEANKALVEKVKGFNDSYGASNPHPDATDQSRRFDSSILPALKLLEKRFKYDIG